jgi:hypothetical protein
MDVTCLSVQGNAAIVSGTISDSNNPAILPGYGFIFGVVDNGEGANATGPDEITLVFSDPNPADLADCAGFTLADLVASGLFPVEAGNIQVH